MRRPAGVLIATLLLSGEVHAQPSIWERVRHPDAEREYEALVSFEVFLLGQARAWDEMNVHKGIVDYLRNEPYRDPRLEFLSAQLRIEATHRSEEVVRTRLARALARHGDSPLAGQGWLNLAQLEAIQRNLPLARECYEHALELLWDDESRARAYYGRAQTFLEAGHPELAVPDYHSSLSHARSPRQRALSHWGLGVSLERSGNLNAGLSEIGRATSIQVQSTAFIIKTVLDLPDVHFLPDYDREYYKALAALAQAEASDVPSQARLDYESAIALFDRYLLRAEVDDQPWVQNAVGLEKLCRERIGALERSRADESPMESSSE